MKFLNVPIFILSLAAGLFIVYLTSDRPDIIHVYPTPDNAVKVQYKDRSGTCFSFKPEEVPCPSDESLITGHPVQARKS